MHTRYLYLESQSIWAIIFIILILLAVKSRRMVIRAALAAIPLALTQGVYQGVWEPNRLGNLPFGIEDVLFCFLAGGISIALVCLLTRQASNDFSDKPQYKRAGLIALIGLVILTGLYFSGVRSYLNNYVSMALTSSIIIILKPRLIKIFLIGSFSLVLVYTLALQPGYLIWPGLTDLWVTGSLSGITIGKAPIEEVIWSFFFGGTWPLIISYISKK